MKKKSKIIRKKKPPKNKPHVFGHLDIPKNCRIVDNGFIIGHDPADDPCWEDYEPDPDDTILK